MFLVSARVVDHIKVFTDRTKKRNSGSSFNQLNMSGYCPPIVRVERQTLRIELRKRGGVFGRLKERAVC